MLTDERFINNRIRLLESMNVSLKRELRYVHPIMKMTTKGRMESSVRSHISSNENEIKALQNRLHQIRIYKERQNQKG